MHRKTEVRYPSMVRRQLSSLMSPSRAILVAHAAAIVEGVVEPAVALVGCLDHLRHRLAVRRIAADPRHGLAVAEGLERFLRTRLVAAGQHDSGALSGES